MQVYLRKNGNATREVNQDCRVFLDLITEIENSGRNITCDNFFTSLSLDRKLLEKKFLIVRTIRKKKPELPAKFTVAKSRTAKSTLFGFQKDAIIASCCPKKNYIVNMLFNKHSLPEVYESLANTKQTVVLFYNSTKSGIDILDGMVRTYSCKRIIRRWPVTLFYKLIDVSAINAFIVRLALISKISNANIRKRRAFLIQLEKELTGIKVQAGLSHPASFAIRANSQKQKLTADNSPRPKKARCHICERSKDKKSRTASCLRKNSVCVKHSKVVCESVGKIY